jgi:hypothetical protein
LIQGSPWQPEKRECCLATGNFNEEIPKQNLEKKMLGKTSSIGMNVYQHKCMKHT